jgi:hypothetical protein
VNRERFAKGSTTAPRAVKGYAAVACVSRSVPAGFSRSESLRVERFSANKVACPTVPIGGVVLIPFRAVQVDVHQGLVLLSRLASQSPLAFHHRPMRAGVSLAGGLGAVSDWRKSSDVTFESP